MMAIDIAAMDAAQKLSFAQAVGSVVLSEGTITDPVLVNDVALPAGYSQFELRFDSLKSNFNNVYHNMLCLAFSDDGGDTFYNNNVTNGTYKHCGQTIAQDSTVTPVGSEGALAFIGLAPLRGTQELISGVVTIMPGSATKNPSVKFSGWTDFAEADDGEGGHQFQMYLIESVVIAPNEQTGEVNTFTPMGRQNVVRMLWQGDNNDANPDGFQSSFSAGSWKLIGYP